MLDTLHWAAKTGRARRYAERLHPVLLHAVFHDAVEYQHWVTMGFRRCQTKRLLSWSRPSGNSRPWIFDLSLPTNMRILAWLSISPVLEDLGRIDWTILQNRDFKRDNNDLGKTDRYQAEALVWKHLPVEGILGICCCTEAVRDGLKARADNLGSSMSILTKPNWYF